MMYTTTTLRNAVIFSVIAICASASLTDEEIQKILDESSRDVAVSNLEGFDTDLRLDNLRDKLRTFGSLEPENEDLFPDQEPDLLGDAIAGIRLEDVFNPYDTDQPQGVQHSPLFLVVPYTTTIMRPKRRWFEKGAFNSLVRARRNPDGNPAKRYTDLPMPKDESRSLTRPQPWMLPDSVKIPFIRSVNTDLKGAPLNEPQDWLIPDGVKIPSIRIPEGYLYSEDLTPTDVQETNLVDNLPVISIDSKRYWMQPEDVNIAPPAGFESPLFAKLAKRYPNKIRVTLSQHSKARDVPCQIKRMKRTPIKSLHLSQVLPLKPRAILKTIPAESRVIGRQGSKAESLRNRMCPNGGYSCTWKEGKK